MINVCHVLYFQGNEAAKFSFDFILASMVSVVISQNFTCHNLCNKHSWLCICIFNSGMFITTRITSYKYLTYVEEVPQNVQLIFFLTYLLDFLPIGVAGDKHG